MTLYQDICSNTLSHDEIYLLLLEDHLHFSRLKVGSLERCLLWTSRLISPALQKFIERGKRGKCSKDSIDSSRCEV